MFLYNAACNDASLRSIMGVVKNGLNIIQIVGPILALISISVHLVHLVNHPDDKKKLNRVKNSFLALAILFFIPMFVNIVFSWLGDSNDISSCWNSSNTSFVNTSYQAVDENSKKSNITSDPGDYQKGVEKPKEENNTNASTSNSASNSGTGDRQGVGNVSASHVIFIGDSRTVQMYAYNTGDWGGANYSSGGVHEVGNDLYVAQGSQGLNWLKSTGIPVAQQYFNSGSAIVILMGVNDLSNANNYINYVNSNATSWKSNGSSLYFVSVNPCSGSYSHLNSKIESFNATVKSGLNNNVGWIDTYSILVNNGFSSTDGLHYDQNTSNTIYNYIKSRV